MRKLILLFVIAPLLMAMQCDDDFDSAGFVTTYFLLNESGTDLYFLGDSGNFKLIPDQTTTDIGSDINPETEAILPSDSMALNQVRLYRMENQDFILVYEQSPLENGLWELDEPDQNIFTYTLRITNESISP